MGSRMGYSYLGRQLEKEDEVFVSYVGFLLSEAGKPLISHKTVYFYH